MSYTFLKCLVFNARSICANLTDFYHVLNSGEFDIILVTETWLKEAIPNSLVDPSHKYNVLRYDRPSSPGGGVCIVLKKCFSFTEITIDDSVEVLAIDVIIQRGK